METGPIGPTISKWAPWYCPFYFSSTSRMTWSFCIHSNITLYGVHVRHWSRSLNLTFWHTLWNSITWMTESPMQKFPPMQIFCSFGCYGRFVFWAFQMLCTQHIRHVFVQACTPKSYVLFIRIDQYTCPIRIICGYSQIINWYTTK